MENRTETVESLPNVGKEAARWLAAAGIRTPSALRKAGAAEAAARVAELRPEDPPCRSFVAGLEGAIRGVRWHAIPKAEREAVWRKYEARRAERGGK